MARQRKDCVAVSFKLEKSIYNKFYEYCASTGIPKTVVVEKALTLYLKNSEKDIVLDSDK